MIHIIIVCIIFLLRRYVNSLMRIMDMNMMKEVFCYFSESVKDKRH